MPLTQADPADVRRRMALVPQEGILFAASYGIGSDVGFRRVYLVRPVYLLVLGYLIGYLGEHERRSKRKLGFMLEMPAAFRRNRHVHETIWVF